MAMIKCSECGKEISDKATSCLHCGCPIEKPKRTVKIIKTGALLLRCSVLIDNQPIGSIGTGTGRDSIELELPIGTHNISVITQVKHGMDFFSPNAISQEQDGTQFEVVESDELIVIELLTKGSWSGSTGRYSIGTIKKYSNDNEIGNKKKMTWNELTRVEQQQVKEYMNMKKTTSFGKIVFRIICCVIFMYLYYTFLNNIFYTYGIPFISHSIFIYLPLVITLIWTFTEPKRWYKKNKDILYEKEILK